MSVVTPPVVRQHGISDDLLALTTLTDIAYIDCHVLETTTATTRTAQQWAHAIMADVPDTIRDQLAAAWSRIELDLHPGAPDTVAGWRIALATPERVVLRANSGLGFHGELVVEVDDGTVRIATFVAMGESWTPAAWFSIVPGHLAFVRSLLERAGQRATGPAL
ncbi:hypothetical protein NONO_c21310 [Nocardia nova SH22a]|uniref:DUF1990 domain-containing protein n=1 Tax=Nocardia nova SH22a TaxID=1415166 RepID=W5TCN7_9NOCA|nr:hypothetical protein [Nocardia nova]AHH16929.1 hypothetical protein NONO_c21310 [Nocardia nova SH22a]